jgi:hypothetical protein
MFYSTKVFRHVDLAVMGNRNPYAFPAEIRGKNIPPVAFALHPSFYDGPGNPVFRLVTVRDLAVFKKSRNPKVVLRDIFGAQKDIVPCADPAAKTCFIVTVAKASSFRVFVGEEAAPGHIFAMPSGYTVEGLIPGEHIEAPLCSFSVDEGVDLSFQTARTG